MDCRNLKVLSFLAERNVLPNKSTRAFLLKKLFVDNEKGNINQSW